MKPNKRDVAGEAFRTGVMHDRAGNLPAAEDCYRHAVSLIPDYDECHNMLGILAHRTGRSGLAVEHLRRAVTIRPSAPDYHNNLGSVLYELGRFADAARSYRKALKLQPERPDFYCNLGCALAGLGNHAEAIASFAAALALKPDFVDAMTGLGNELLRTGRPAEALPYFDASVSVRPAAAPMHGNRGAALQALNRIDEAIASFREMVRLDPASAKAWSLLGLALTERDDTEAIACLEQALSLSPGDTGRYIDLGAALLRQRRVADAVAVYRRGLDIDANSAELECGLAHAALTIGDYETGWPAFEARWRCTQFGLVQPRTGARAWDGRADIDGKAILLFAEQGFGDTIQFVRFAPLLAERGANVYLLVQPQLVSLLSALPGVKGCFGFGSQLPRVDLHYPLMSLPIPFGTTLETIPSDCPYLPIDSEAAAIWRLRSQDLPGLKIGLVWAGDSRPHQPNANSVDRRRSLRFNQMEPLSGLDGVSLISLQKGQPAAQARVALPGLTLHNWTDELHSFADTAALISTLDLVISADTAVAHLAGALGRPVWLLNRFDSCWRWLDSRDDSPWYPTLRQFRQTKPGDWADVMSRVRAALVARLNEY